MWTPSCGISRCGRLNVGGSRFGRICTSRRLSAACSRASASLGVVTASAVFAIAAHRGEEALRRHALLPGRPRRFLQQRHALVVVVPHDRDRRAVAGVWRAAPSADALSARRGRRRSRAAPPARVSRRAPRCGRCARGARAPASARSSGRSTRSSSRVPATLSACVRPSQPGWGHATSCRRQRWGAGGGG